MLERQDTTESAPRLVGPIAWDELDDPDLAPDRWTIATLPARNGRNRDLGSPP
jgi:hypothetical protein